MGVSLSRALKLGTFDLISLQFLVAAVSPTTFIARTAISNATVTTTSDAPYTGAYYTYTTLLKQGTIVLLVPAGPSGNSNANTTLVGPTFFSAQYPISGVFVHGGINTLDPHCNHTATSTSAGKYVTVASRVAVLSEGQTLTTYLRVGQASGTPITVNYPSWANQTFTGPSTLSLTTVYNLLPNDFAQLALDMVVEWIQAWLVWEYAEYVSYTSLQFLSTIGLSQL